MNVDELYMRRCLQLAANGLGRVRPNPLVGCVIVRGGKIVSEGYHQEYGHNHAERNALLRLDSSSPQLGEVSRSDGGVCCGATLYVNLEPCSHYGKTPPCADLIIEKGVKRVVCCNDDPNPLVAGNGFRKLQEAGIEVVRHVLEEEGRELNRRFFTFMEKCRPYVILKWAESADGFMAPNAVGPYWLSTQEQNRLNHRWRTEEAAILVGSETYLQDKPSLTPRHYIGPAPQPVVLDRRGRLVHSSTTAEQRSPSPNFAPLRSQAVSLSEPGRREEPDSFNRDSNSPPKLGGVPRRGEGVCPPENWMVLHTATVAETLQALYEAKLQSVIVEGGRQILDAFIASGLYDEVRILRSPQPLGSGLPAPEIPPIVPSRLTIVEP